MNFFPRCVCAGPVSPPRGANWQAQRARALAKFLAVFMRFGQVLSSVSRSCRDSKLLLGSALAPLLLALSLGCSSAEIGEQPSPALLHSKMASTASSIAEASWMHLPVPPEDGPKL